MKHANVFDPIKDQLDQKVFSDITPRPRVVRFLTETFNNLLGTILLDPEQYFKLFITGSLTTYQYSETSDLDVTVFSDFESLLSVMMEEDADSVRKQLVELVIDKLDGRVVPGTQHPVQFFIAPDNVFPEDMYKPGMRSGWDIQNEDWVTPPEKDRVHDIPRELPALYRRAEDVAEKMELMLDHDPDVAREMWRQIHIKRWKDEHAGLGDFSEGNIVYKYLLHRGLFDRLRNELQIKISHYEVIANRNLADEPVKVIYDFEKDRLILGTEGQEIRSTLIVGEYDGKNLQLYSNGQEWLNANYLRRLWMSSFPTRPLENITFEGKDLPPRKDLANGQV